MKELCQFEMNDVSGAGFLDSIIYTNYDDFGQYLQWMNQNHMNPLSVVDHKTGQSPSGLIPAFNAWCNKTGVDPEMMVTSMGWEK